MTEIADPGHAPVELAERARELVRARLRAAIAEQRAGDPEAPAIGDELVDRLVAEVTVDPDDPLWRIALAHALAAERRISIPQALLDPALGAAGAAAAVAAPPEAGDASRARQALRFAAVHAHGIETLAAGDADIELRLSEVGLDVLKPSTGSIVGRLEWGEIELMEVRRTRRGLGGFRRVAQLEIATDRGEALFELPDLTDEEVATYLEPMLQRHARPR